MNKNTFKKYIKNSGLQLSESDEEVIIKLLSKAYNNGKAYANRLNKQEQERKFQEEREEYRNSQRGNITFWD